jgi:hypothetical protein
MPLILRFPFLVLSIPGLTSKLHTAKLIMAVVSPLVWARFRTYCTDNINILSLVNNQLNHLFGLQRKLQWKQHQPFFCHGRHRCDTFHAYWLRRSVPEAYVSKSDVVVVKNSPCQADLIVWALFLTDCTDNIFFLPLVTTELNDVLGLQWKLPWEHF